MADIPVWLRFQRSRTPTLAGFRVERGCILSGTSENDAEIHRPRTISRTPLQPRLDCPRATVASIFDGHSQVNHVDDIWYNPDPDQMAETLKVFMMARSSFHPVPVKFNSCILHILEAYQDMRHQLTTKDEEIQAMRQNYKDAVKNFEQEVLQWQNERENYKSEIKMLETILTTEARDPNPAMMAGSSSVSYRGNTWKESNGRDKHSDYEFTDGEPNQGLNDSVHEARTAISRYPPITQPRPVTLNFLTEKDLEVTEKYTLQRRGPQHSRAPKPSSETLNWAKESDVGLAQLTSQRAPPDKQQPRDNYPTGDSAPKTGNFAAQHSNKFYDGNAEGTTRSRVWSSSNDSKPLPKVPTSPPNMLLDSSLGNAEDTSTPHGDRTRSNQSITRHRFSFMPGDDYGFLPSDIAGKQLTAKAFQRYASPNGQRPSELGASMTAESPQIIQIGTINQLKKLTKSEGKLESGKPNKSDKGAQLTREDSQSSIITIIKDDSGQSGRAQEFCNRNSPEWPKLKRRNKSNEARIAAVRALSGTERTTITRPKKSGAQDEEPGAESSNKGERKEVHIAVNKGTRGTPRSQGV